MDGFRLFRGEGEFIFGGRGGGGAVGLGLSNLTWCRILGAGLDGASSALLGRVVLILESDVVLDSMGFDRAEGGGIAGGAESWSAVR